MWRRRDHLYPTCHADTFKVYGKGALFAGNATTIGSLLFNFAYLRGFFGDYPALTPTQQASLATLASQNITSTLGATKLTAQKKREAFAEACALGLQQREPQAIAVLAGAALSASDASAIKDGFAMVGIP